MPRLTRPSGALKRKQDDEVREPYQSSSRWSRHQGSFYLREGGYDGYEFPIRDERQNAPVQISIEVCIPLQTMSLDEPAVASERRTAYTTPPPTKRIRSAKEQHPREAQHASLNIYPVDEAAASNTTNDDEVMGWAGDTDEDVLNAVARAKDATAAAVSAEEAIERLRVKRWAKKLRDTVPSVEEGPMMITTPVTDTEDDRCMSLQIFTKVRNSSKVTSTKSRLEINVSATTAKIHDTRLADNRSKKDPRPAATKARVDIALQSEYLQADSASEDDSGPGHRIAPSRRRSNNEANRRLSANQDDDDSSDESSDGEPFVEPPSPSSPVPSENYCPSTPSSSADSSDSSTPFNRGLMTTPPSSPPNLLLSPCPPRPSSKQISIPYRPREMSVCSRVRPKANVDLATTTSKARVKAIPIRPVAMENAHPSNRTTTLFQRAAPIHFPTNTGPVLPPTTLCQSSSAGMKVVLRQATQTVALSATTCSMTETFPARYPTAPDSTPPVPNTPIYGRERFEQTLNSLTNLYEVYQQGSERVKAVTELCEQFLYCNKPPGEADIGTILSPIIIKDDQ